MKLFLFFYYIVLMHTHNLYFYYNDKNFENLLHDYLLNKQKVRHRINKKKIGIIEKIFLFSKIKIKTILLHFMYVVYLILILNIAYIN